MKPSINIVDKIPQKANTIHLVFSEKEIKKLILSNEERKYVNNRFKADKSLLIPINRFDELVFIQTVKPEDEDYLLWESLRKSGDKALALLNENEVEELWIDASNGDRSACLSFAEGMALGNYRFDKYKKANDEQKAYLAKINLLHKDLKKADIDQLDIQIDAVYTCRDLVNEPLSTLNAVKLSEEVKRLGAESGLKVEVFNKKKIESLKMGGLLAVNKGSVDPPTFSIMEWKPEKPVNKKPIILVGKGVVFDTGGMNIKTGNYMEHMKCDMAGAATMISATYAIARAKLPVHVIALIPATDNRPHGNAYVPGDIIRMYDGTTVEIINTDAEGRMILADALSYAKKYKPALVINAATLTGAASQAIGKYGIVAMQVKASKEMEKLKTSGFNKYERIAEFPFWEEYGELIKSNVADIKNIGGIDAGMITAGKFLEKFTNYPFIHLDIAGPAYIEKKDSYKTAGGTGMGVRLLFDFISQVASGK